MLALFNVLQASQPLKTIENTNKVIIDSILKFKFRFKKTLFVVLFNKYSVGKF
jgi:hypothetical protein